jgi:cysteine desulfurase/selenocysteine lyase
MTRVADTTAPARPTGAAGAFDVDRVRADFPILQQQINGHPLVYLDNAATAQKPQCVIDAISHHYTCDNANIHRGVHTLSVRATEGYESARRKAAMLIHAERPEEIVFVRSATEGINLVAQTLGRATLKAGDEVLITTLEHHSNIVPWQMVCQQTGATLRVAPINDAGELIIEEFERLVGQRTRIVAVGHVSNALGTINPVRELTEIAHRFGAHVLIDGAQAVPHTTVDVQEIDADFYVYSSHKLFGPTGVGVLYGKFDLLESIPPYQGGGEMIRSVTFDQTTYNTVPHRFEAGTPNIAGTIGLGAAIDYVMELGLDRIAAYEHELLTYAIEALSAIPQVRLIGTADPKAAVIAFVIDGIHAHDVGTMLDQMGVAVRTGHHCAQPVVDRFGLPATARASLAFYNTRAEIDTLIAGVRQVIEVFA